MEENRSVVMIERIWKKEMMTEASSAFWKEEGQRGDHKTARCCGLGRRENEKPSSCRALKQQKNREGTINHNRRVNTIACWLFALVGITHPTEGFSFGIFLRFTREFFFRFLGRFLPPQILHLLFSGTSPCPHVRFRSLFAS
jgi:hypothetical protein